MEISWSHCATHECCSLSSSSWSYGVLYSNRALCYLKLGDFKAARSDGYRCTKLSPTYVKVSMRPWALLRLPSSAQAFMLQCFFPQGHYLYVMAWYKLGKAERALECLEKAFRLCVTDPPPPDLLNLRKEITDYLGGYLFHFLIVPTLRLLTFFSFSHALLFHRIRQFCCVWH